MSTDTVKTASKNILFIAFYYPPVRSTNVPGAMRTIKFVKHLSSGNFHVLTTQPEIKPEDSALKHILLPVKNENIYPVAPWDIFKIILRLRAKIKSILKTAHTLQPAEEPEKNKTFEQTAPARVANPGKLQRLKDFIYDCCYFPDQAAPWIWPASITAIKLAKKNAVDVIFATGSPWSGLITGYLVSKFTRIPLIVDFRDPWVDNPFHKSKGHLLDRLGEKIEKKIVNHAAAISLNTEPLYEAFKKRYPNLPQERFFVLPNGFDETDAQPVPKSTQPQISNTLTLCHAGFLYGLRDPSTLLNAIQAVNNASSGQAKKIVFKQIGEVQLDFDIQSRYASMIADNTLQLEPACTYNECLDKLGHADLVVNIQPATKTQVPSKLYDYLAINRPILNITPADGALGTLVKKYELGYLFDFDDEQGLTSMLLDLASAPKNSIDFDGYESRPLFDCKTISALLDQRITEVLNN